MILKKAHFPFFYLLLIICSLFSCESNVKKHPTYLALFDKAELNFKKAKQHLQKCRLT